MWEMVFRLLFNILPLSFQLVCAYRLSKANIGQYGPLVSYLSSYLRNRVTSIELGKFSMCSGYSHHEISHSLIHVKSRMASLLFLHRKYASLCCLNKHRNMLPKLSQHSR